jgi:hypothetical protein
LTLTPRLAAFALQTQTAKVAACPGFTCEALEKDWTRTHSCGVLDLGGGELFVGVGVGVGEVGDGLAVGLGEDPDGLFEGEADGGDELGLVLGAELELGDWLGVELLDVEVGLVVGLELPALGLELPALGLELAELPEELDEPELGVELAPVLLEGEVVALLEGDVVAEEVRPGEEGAGELADGRSAASRAAPFGIVAHAAGTMGPLLPDWAARAWPSKLEETKAKPVRTPTTAGLTTNWALTCATSLRQPRPVRPASS